MNLKSFIRVFVTLLTATLLSCVLVSAQDISLNMRDVKVSRVIAEIQARYWIFGGGQIVRNRYGAEGLCIAEGC